MKCILQINYHPLLTKIPYFCGCNCLIACCFCMVFNLISMWFCREPDISLRFARTSNELLVLNVISRQFHYVKFIIIYDFISDNYFLSLVLKIWKLMPLHHSFECKQSH